MSTPSAPVSRVLAPDLARGAMLLLIALANVPSYLWGAQYEGYAAVSMHPSTGGVLDRAVQALTIVTIDGRIYPMFTFLLGYGMVQFARSRREQGLTEDDVRLSLHRRHLGLIVLGLLHAALLFAGDVLGTYGFLGLVMVALFFGCRTRTLAWWCGILTGLLLLFLVAMWSLEALLPTDDAAVQAGLGLLYGANTQTDYLASMGSRLALWAFTAPVAAVIGSVLPSMVLLSWIAARAQVLERPGDHLPLLRRVAVGGVAIGWLSGLPSAAAHLGVIDAPATSWPLVLAQIGGFVCGVGYVATFALLAHHLAAAPGESLARRVLVATGRASLTCYLLQSVVFAPLFDAWGLGLGAHLGSAAAAGIAVLTWAATAFVAMLLMRAGRRGPAEVALRRFSGSSR